MKVPLTRCWSILVPHLLHACQINLPFKLSAGQRLVIHTSCCRHHRHQRFLQRHVWPTAHPLTLRALRRQRKVANSQCRGYLNHRSDFDDVTSCTGRLPKCWCARGGRHHLGSVASRGRVSCSVCLLCWLIAALSEPPLRHPRWSVPQRSH